MAASGKKVKVVGSDGMDAEYAAFKTQSEGSAAGDLVALNASNQIDSSFLPGVGPEQIASVLASETIAAGDLVNVYNNAGTLNVRKADKSTASRGKVANGYAPAGITSAASGLIYLSGQQNGYTCLTPGAVQFLGNTGARTETPTTTSGETLQPVGFAINATTIEFKIDPSKSTIRA